MTSFESDVKAAGLSVRSTILGPTFADGRTLGSDESTLERSGSVPHLKTIDSKVRNCARSRVPMRGIEFSESLVSTPMML